MPEVTQNVYPKRVWQAQVANANMLVRVCHGGNTVVIKTEKNRKEGAYENNATPTMEGQQTREEQNSSTKDLLAASMRCIV